PGMRRCRRRLTSPAVQLAVVRGARVIGTASPANHEYLRSLGAEPVAYGEGLVERVRALAPDGVDAALDVAGSGVLPELIELAGGPEHVVTIADFGGAQEHGVRFSSGDAGRAVHALAEIGELIESGRFSLPILSTFRTTHPSALRGQIVSAAVTGALGGWHAFLVWEVSNERRSFGGSRARSGSRPGVPVGTEPGRFPAPGGVHLPGQDRGRRRRPAVQLPRPRRALVAARQRAEVGRAGQGRSRR